MGKTFLMSKLSNNESFNFFLGSVYVRFALLIKAKKVRKRPSIFKFYKDIFPLNSAQFHQKLN